MTNLTITLYPDPILQRKTERIAIADIKKASTKKLISNMLETMDANNGVGLAAPQVGKSLRLCVIRSNKETYVLVNPTIQYKSWAKETGEEGCLSFPGKFIQVKRHKKVRVKAHDQNGESITIKAEGFLARVLQHEIDHLDGKLYIEKEAKSRKKLSKNLDEK